MYVGPARRLLFMRSLVPREAQAESGDTVATFEEVAKQKSKSPSKQVMALASAIRESSAQSTQATENMLKDLMKEISKVSATETAESADSEKVKIDKHRLLSEMRNTLTHYEQKARCGCKRSGKKARKLEKQIDEIEKELGFGLGSDSDSDGSEPEASQA